MSRNLIVIVVVVLLLIATGWFLMRPQQSTSPVMQETQSPTSTASASPEASSPAQMTDVREIKVSGSEFKFAPNTLTFKKGEKVRLVFENTGKMPHDLKIDELGVATKVIQPGQTDSVEFTPQNSGNFPMYCSVGNHRNMGMEGKVSVQ